MRTAFKFTPNLTNTAVHKLHGCNSDLLVQTALQWALIRTDPIVHPNFSTSGLRRGRLGDCLFFLDTQAEDCSFDHDTQLTASVHLSSTKLC